jgi:hypothetical protein
LCAVHLVESKEELRQIMVFPPLVRDSLREYRSSAIPAKEAGHVPKNTDGKDPGTKLIVLQTSRIEVNLIVEWVGGVAAFEFDEHFHLLERGQVAVRVARVDIVEGDVWFVL